MSEPHARSRLGRSIRAVLAGIATCVIFSLGTDALLYRAGIFPALGQPMGDRLLLLATVYRTVYNIAGSYIAARLAPDRPMTHALWLGVVGVVVCVLGAVATWSKGPAFGPQWYPVTLIVLALPCAWVGGRLFETQTGMQSA